jgi:hypothetical protein
MAIFVVLWAIVGGVLAAISLGRFVRGDGRRGAVGMLAVGLAFVLIAVAWLRL